MTTKSYKLSHFIKPLLQTEKIPIQVGTQTLYGIKTSLTYKFTGGFFLIVCVNQKEEQWEEKWEGDELKIPLKDHVKLFHKDSSLYLQKTLAS